MSNPRKLRPYQEETLAAIRKSVGQGIRRLVLQAPTGSGKTMVASAIAAGAQAKNNRLVFCVSSIGLIDQAVQMFWDEGIRDVGVIQADHPLTDWSKPIQVASIQTIRSRGVYPEAQVVVIDEVHQLHKEHTRWIGKINKDSGLPEGCPPGWENVPVIGLSATPWTRGLGRYFQSLLVMSTTEELIRAGYLSKFVVYAADRPDLSGVKVARGDYVESQLSQVMSDNSLVANIVETYKQRWGKGKTLCFGVDRAHAQMLQARFQDAGISTAYQDALTTRLEREAIKKGFHSGQYDIVCNVGTLTTGVDWDVRCLILARPTKSEMLFVQIVGRALRTAEGKDKAIILDHTDTTCRLGMVTDIHHENLNGGRFDELDKKVVPKPPLPKPCPKCAVLIPPRSKKCPGCGFERKIESKIYEKEGTLVEFTGAFRKKGDTKAYTYTHAEKTRFYAQLRGYGLMKGYQDGWAANKYREKFKAWPAWDMKGVEPMAPGPEVSQWIKFCNIQWAMSQRKKNAQGPNQRTFDI